MKMPNLTEAQCRALAFLPASRQWLMKLGRMGPAVDSLHLYHREYIEIEYGDFGPRAGRMRRVRLTEAGVALRAQLTAPPTE